MKKFFVLSLAASLIYNISSATIRRLGFFGTPVTNVDYTSFTLAYNAANSGDTILVFPGINITATIAKKLIIIGSGYWLGSGTTPKGNDNLQAFTGSSSIGGNVVFSSGSAGSVIMGFDFQGNSVYIGENNITIRRNNNLSVQLQYVGTNNNNIQILENYRVTIGYYSSAGVTNTNLYVSNNLINNISFSSSNTNSGIISNNIMVYDGTITSTDGGSSTLSSFSANDLGGGTFLVQNNIFCSYTTATATSNINFTFNNATGSTFNYNLSLPCNTSASYVSNLGVWASGTGNVITAIGNASQIFAAFPAIGTSSADARYQLASGSPALTMGQGGTAIGMFAGSSPYKLSLIPSIPTIYQLTSPNGNNPTGSTLTINLSTRANN